MENCQCCRRQDTEGEGVCLSMCVSAYCSDSEDDILRVSPCVGMFPNGNRNHMLVDVKQSTAGSAGAAVPEFQNFLLINLADDIVMRLNAQRI